MLKAAGAFWIAVVITFAGPCCSVADGARQVIDGAKNPEEIPDQIAWLMFFKTIADGTNAPTHSARSALIRQAGFDASEADDLIFAANEAMARIHAMEVPILRSSMTTDAKVQALRRQRDLILEDVVAGLRARWSPEAGERFRAHIDQRVKRGTRITK